VLEIILPVVKSETVLAALIGAAASITAGLVAQYFKRLAERRGETEREKIRRTIAAVSRDLGTLRISRSLERRPAEARESSEALLQELEQQVLRRISAEPDKTEDRIKEELENEMREFEDRIEKIERRSPEDAPFDKIASINAAILSERVDQLSERIDGLENKALSRLDVAITVSAVIGGVFAVVAAIYAFLIFLSGNVQ
jgi:gas vesicle protein